MLAERIPEVSANRQSRRVPPARPRTAAKTVVDRRLIGVSDLT